MSKKNGLKNNIMAYINSISKKMPIKQVILFGSYAKGKPSEHSDIDLAVFSPKFSDKSHLRDVKFLWTEAAKIDSRIEPLPFSTAEIRIADSRSFLSGILKSGKIVYKR